MVIHQSSEPHATEKTVLITRPKASAQELALALQQWGFHCEIFPTIDILPLTDWLRNVPPLQDYDGIIFTSANGVLYFLSPLKQYLPDQWQRLLTHTIYAVGDKTKVTLAEYGIFHPVVPAEQNAAGLCKLLSQIEVKGKRLLFVCGKSARPTLPNCIAALGGLCEECVVYETVRPADTDCERIRAWLHSGKIHVIAFASPSAVQHFAELLGPVPSSVKIAAIGPTTASEARTQLGRVDVVSARPTNAHFAEAIARALLSA